MRVQAKWHHVFAVTREVEIDPEAFIAWKNSRHGQDSDTDLALSIWIDEQDTDLLLDVFQDWRTSDPLPHDFELQYSEVIDAAYPESD